MMCSWKNNSNISKRVINNEKVNPTTNANVLFTGLEIIKMFKKSKVIPITKKRGDKGCK
jgi:hypothetical protein